MTVLETFRLVATEFNDVPNDVVIQYIALAEGFQDFSVYPEKKRDLANALLAAHLLWIANNSGGVEGASGGGSGGFGGTIRMEKEGDLQREYAQSSISDSSHYANMYSKSIYGQQLMMIDSTVFLSSAMTRMSDLV
jgi:hypothetical protein